MPTVTEKGITQWTIPENIHTIPQTASRNSEGKGEGGSLFWKSEGMGEYLRLDSEGMEGLRSGIHRGQTR